MTAQDVIVYLNTPLWRIDAPMMDGVCCVRGRLLAEEVGGVTVQVKALGNGKKWQDDYKGLKKIFIPFHKIDFISLE